MNHQEYNFTRPIKSFASLISFQIDITGPNINQNPEVAGREGMVPEM